MYVCIYIYVCALTPSLHYVCLQLLWIQVIHFPVFASVNDTEAHDWPTRCEVNMAIMSKSGQ